MKSWLPSFIVCVAVLVVGIGTIRAWDKAPEVIPPTRVPASADKDGGLVAWEGHESGHCRGCHDGRSPHPEGFPECLTCHDQQWGGGAGKVHHHVYNDLDTGGFHAELDCADCHSATAEHIVDWSQPEPGKCINCHDAGPHDNPDALVCSECHSPQRPFANPEGFEHEPPLAKLRLEGYHATVACEHCHTLNADAVQALGNTWANVDEIPPESLDCSTCHGTPHGELEVACTTCHTVNTRFDATPRQHEPPVADFQLIGVHEQLECASCHGENAPAATPADAFDCGSCHVPIHEGAFQLTCTSCHWPEGEWEASWFQREDHPGVALIGQHTPVECVTCHVPAQDYHPAGDSCIDCHAESNPHTDERADQDCAGCHTSVGWVESARIDHSQTDFPLEGRHTELACDSCHRPNDVWVKPEPVCANCHVPDHVGPRSVFGAEECDWCHTPNGWPNARPQLARHNRTSFPLTGRHQRIACIDCHLDRSGRAPQVRSLDTVTCVDCHESPHREADRSSHCADCHTTSSWRVR